MFLTSSQLLGQRSSSGELLHRRQVFYSFLALTVYLYNGALTPACRLCLLVPNEEHQGGALWLSVCPGHCDLISPSSSRCSWSPRRTGSFSALRIPQMHAHIWFVTPVGKQRLLPGPRVFCMWNVCALEDHVAILATSHSRGTSWKYPCGAI